MNYWDILLAEKLKKDPPLPPIPDNAYLLEQATGDVITLTDAAALPMPSATTTLQPIQDLHGYEYPWVGGAGKNLMPINEVDQQYNIGITCNIPAGNYTMSYNAPDGKALACRFFYVAGDNDQSVELTQNERNVTFERTVVSCNLTVTNYSAGTTVTNIQLEQGTQATAFAPYSNICPISGYDSAEYTRTGVNIWDEEWEVGTIDINTGENVTYNNYFRSKNYICVTPNTSYYVHRKDTIYVFKYGKDKSYIGYTTSPTTLLIDENTHYIRFVDISRNTYNNDISINYPSTITTYQPYQAQAVTLTFDNTVYSGTVDWCTGVVTVDKGMEVFDGSEDEGWNNYGSGSASAFAMKTTKIQGLTYTQLISTNYLKILSNDTTWGNYDGWISIGSAGNTNSVVTGIKSITTVADWRTYLSNNNLQVLYELSTPITYQLTASQLTTLAGYNTIYTDIGNISLEYWTKEVRA